jgi:hypothetical protein
MLSMCGTVAQGRRHDYARINDAWPDLFGSPRNRRKWTRSQRIRTVGQVPFEVTITETVPPPAYQRIAVEAQRLARLGLCFTRIAKALGVTDKTVAKAITWIGDPLEPGSGKRSP